MSNVEMRPQLPLPIGRGTATCLGIVLSGMICGCFTAARHAAADLDLAAHRVAQVQNQHATANESPDWTEWQNFLVFTNANIRIPLARAMNPVLNGQHKATGIVLINRQLKQYE